MKKLFFFIIISLNLHSYAQKFSLEKTEFNLEKQFQILNYGWKPKNVFLRVFKYEKELEVWINEEEEQEFKLFKIYKICMSSGTLGPKRKEGDLQVPEGFYFINDFNSSSNYHLSLGINYPNNSDKILGSKKNLGGSIYIHGDCVSIGCIALSNSDIEEVFTICKSSINKEVQVHIFPIRFDNSFSNEYLNEKTKLFSELYKFEKNISNGFFYFQNRKKLPYIIIDSFGEYLFF